MKTDTEFRGQGFFQEVQSFNAPPANWLLLAILALMAGLSVYTLTDYFRSPGSDHAPLVSGVATLIAAIVTWLLLNHCRMETDVRTDGLFIRFRPFIWNWKRIETANMVRHRAVTYSPLWEYGGWGIRIGWKRRAYNPSGTRGVRIEFDDGRHVLIGSAKSEQLDAALSRMLEQRGR